ncbi:hypothetical protein DPMN_148875 [Dreissena polymorpha]|uniref:Uncharacterized protein n=1 Tax=Dreissena polymorpha TaxID=45954 RepID=A0A9D4FAQ2_DREPO|nr:hypothetical protein DPMN_148875 [Dreissena polymorpha]
MKMVLANPRCGGTMQTCEHATGRRNLCLATNVLLLQTTSSPYLLQIFQAHNHDLCNQSHRVPALKL